MYLVFLLLISCTVLAFIYSYGSEDVLVSKGGSTYTKRKSTGLAKIAFLALAVTMVLYAGLRSSVNDTAMYAKGYRDLSIAFSDISWSLGDNPLFHVYEVIIKRFVSTNPSVLFLVTAVFVELSYLIFIKKYAVHFGLSIFVLIGFTLYAFTMAALKQTMAVAIAIWSVPLILEKKYVRAIILIAIATMFHAFSFLFLVALVMRKSIWDRRAVIIIVATIIVGIFFSMFVGQALGFTESIGGNVYEDEDFVRGTGTSFFRIIVYVIPSILTFVYRKQLREVNSPFLNVSVNLSLIAACFMVLAGLGGANLTGRLAGYFDIFICFSLPAVIVYGIESKRLRSIATIILFLAFAYFYYSYYKKFAVLYPDPFTDYYHHVSLLDVFSGR